MKKFFLFLTMLLFSAFSYICLAQNLNQTALLNYLKKTKHTAKEVLTIDEVRLNPYDFKHPIVALAEFQAVQANISSTEMAKEYDSTKYKEINCGGKIENKSLPLIVSLKQQKNITEKLLDLKEGDMVLLGGKIKSYAKKDTKGKKMKDVPKQYVFEIEFIESVPEEVLNATAEKSNAEEKTESEPKTKPAKDSKKDSANATTETDDSDISFDADENTAKTDEKKSGEKKTDDEKQEGVEWLE